MVALHGVMFASWRGSVLRRVDWRQLHAARRNRRSFLPSVIIGLGIWIGFPTVAAFQDMQSLVSGSEGSNARWNAFVETAVAGSTHAAEMPFVVRHHHSQPRCRHGGPPGHCAALQDKRRREPDEERTRGDKQGRVAKVMPVAPPKAFNAGSVFKRTSMLLHSTLDKKMEMAFAAPQIRGKEIQIAAAFHTREDPKPDPLLPPVLAALVNNDKGDVLATAYGPAKPDYAAASPFETLLKDGTADSGRFIPPMAEGDPGWVSSPLPPSVFSAQERASPPASISRRVANR